MEVLFHSKAFTSCVVASFHVCPRGAKSAVVELRRHSRYNPKPNLSCQTKLRECDRGGGDILTPLILWLRYSICCNVDSLFPVVRAEKNRGYAEHSNRWLRNYQSAFFCTSKCNWTRLQDCTHLIQLAARLPTNWNIIDCRPHGCNDPHVSALPVNPCF